MIGFEPIPSVTSGINYDHKSMPPRIVEVYGPAEAVGVQVGDLILEVDGKKIDDHFWVIKHLNTKRVGERVNLKVQRGENVLSFSMNLVNR